MVAEQLTRTFEVLVFGESGEKAAVGRRCTGAVQHCIFPWYTSSIYSYEVREDLYKRNETFF